MATHAFWTIFAFVAYTWIGLTLSECEYRRKCEGNTASKIANLEPDAFWPISAAYHATDISETNNNPVLTSTGAEITEDPELSSNEGFDVTRESMVFTGELHSYAELANPDGSLNGGRMFTWVLYILPDSIDLISANGYIMAYYGTNGQDGLQLLQRGPNLVLQVYDRNANLIESVHANAFPSLKWTSLLISFSGQSSPAQIETNVIVPDDHRPTEDHQAATLGEINFVNARGNIRFGGSFDDSEPSFRGRISCIMKFDVFLFGGAAKEAHTLCDPNLYTDPGVSTYWSIDSIPPPPPPQPELITIAEPEQQPTTTTTTTTKVDPESPSSTTKAETEPPPTTTKAEPERPQTTRQAKPPTTTQQPEPPTTKRGTSVTEQTSGEVPLTTRILVDTATSGYSEPDVIPLNTCIRHHLYLEGFVLTSPILSQSVDAAQDCSRLCRRTSNCVSFSVTGRSAETQLTCSLGSDLRPQDVAPYTGARIFTLV